MAYVRRNYPSSINLNLAAAEIGISPGRLSRLFVEETGKGFAHYLISYRLEKAKEMLAKPGATIKEVSAACGYPDQNYFARLFKKVTGAHPQFPSFQPPRRSMMKPETIAPGEQPSRLAPPPSRFCRQAPSAHVRRPGAAHHSSARPHPRRPATDQKSGKLPINRRGLAFSLDSLVVERWKRDIDIFEKSVHEMGAEFILEVADQDASKQDKQVRALADRGIDVLVIVSQRR